MSVIEKVKKPQLKSSKIYLYPRYQCWESAAQRCWEIYSKSVLKKNAKQYNQELSKSVENYLLSRRRSQLMSSDGMVDPTRVEDWQVIGKCDKDYLYIDKVDESVWVYYFESGSVQRLEDNFSDWKNNTRSKHETTEIDLGPAFLG